MSNTNLFDVCIPTYNRTDLLVQLLKSIDEDISVHISDNGGFVSQSTMVLGGNTSITNVKKVVEMFDNWALAANMSKSRFFLLSSDDDLYSNLSSNLVKDELSAHPDVGMIVFGHNVIDENNNIISHWCPSRRELLEGKAAFKEFCFGVDARMPSIFINTSIYNKLGGISTDFKITAADSELIQRMSINAPVLFVPEIISSYRVWNGGITHQKLASKQWRDEIDLWMQKLDASLKKAAWGNNKLWRRHIQDDIRLQNVNAGLSKIVGLKNGLNFLFIKNYPFFARPKTHARCLIQLVKCMFGRH